MADVLEYRTIDKTSWGEGPWSNEIDKRQWTDADTGLPCLIVRGPTGALCGYVGVSKDHPAHGLNYDHWRWEEGAEPLTPIQEAINGISAHGGLTFADGCSHGSQDRSICHVPADGEADDVWWFGFDCAHAGDYRPAFDRLHDPVLGLGKPTGWGTVIEYRDVAYVAAQCASLAGQLNAMGSPASKATAQVPDEGSREEPLLRALQSKDQDNG